MSGPEGSAPNTTPKPFIFVLMPFDSKFNDTYRFGIKGAADDAGAYAERLNDQLFTEGMLDRIFNQISKADVIVADMTGRNSNVFYEVGYAHALNKIVIPLTRDTNDIPFDLRHRQHIVYADADSLREPLARYLTWAVEESRRRAQGKKGGRLSVVVDGNRVLDAVVGDDSPLIDLPMGNVQLARPIRIAVENTSFEEATPPITHIYLMTTTDPMIVPCEPTDEMDGDILDISYLPRLSPRRDRTTAPFTLRYRLDASVAALPPQAEEEFTLWFTLRPPRKSVQQQFRLRLHSSTQFFDYDFTLNVDVPYRPPLRRPALPQDATQAR